MKKILKFSRKSALTNINFFVFFSPAIFQNDFSELCQVCIIQYSDGSAVNVEYSGYTDAGDISALNNESENTHNFYANIGASLIPGQEQINYRRIRSVHESRTITDSHFQKFLMVSNSSGAVKNSDRLTLDVNADQVLQFPVRRKLLITQIMQV